LLLSLPPAFVLRWFQLLLFYKTALPRVELGASSSSGKRQPSWAIKAAGRECCTSIIRVFVIVICLGEWDLCLFLGAFREISIGSRRIEDLISVYLFPLNRGPSEYGILRTRMGTIYTRSYTLMAQYINAQMRT
jgi:hypothetical protein